MGGILGHGSCSGSKGIPAQEACECNGACVFHFSRLSLAREAGNASGLPHLVLVTLGVYRSTLLFVVHSQGVTFWTSP